MTFFKTRLSLLLRLDLCLLQYHDAILFQSELRLLCILIESLFSSQFESQMSLIRVTLIVILKLKKKIELKSKFESKKLNLAELE